jgi:hypothetical protein
MMARRWLTAALIAAALARPAMAHDVRPAYLELIDTGAGRIELLWKEPLLGDASLGIVPVLPESCRDVEPPATQQLPGTRIIRRVVNCGAAGLDGRTIRIDGLPRTLTDALVRIQFADGRTHTEILRPSRPSLVVTAAGSSRGPATFVTMGIEHILSGFDHLLFVFGLMLLVTRGWLLLQTVTAFTAGHSVSLALATFGVVAVPAAPVDAAIALSIVFLAAEIVRAQRGERHLTARWPWIVAGAFGLLHGLGFATALTALGLPRADIPMALLLFNVGVEIGQILFIAAVLVLLAAWRILGVRWPAWARPLPVYGMGSVATYWFLGRFTALF